MESVSRANWTDERLDDFARNTDHRFDGVDHRFDEVDRRFREVDRRFDSIDANLRDLRSEMDAHFGRIETRLDALNRAMLQVGGGMFATFVVGFVGLVVTQG